MPAPIKINWNFLARIDGGPQLAESKPSLEVSAYDYSEQVLVAPAAPATPTTADVAMPGLASSMVAILADSYSDKLTYVIDGGATKFTLDAPHVFLGAGASAFLGAAPPAKLTFSNASTGAVTVKVLVGR